MKSLETQIAELTQKLTASEAEVTRLQGVIAEADKTVAAAKLAEFCKEAALPQVAVEKLQAAFKNAVTVNGMQEAVNTEKKYIDALGVKEAAVITRNNGAQRQSAAGEVKEAELKAEQVKAFRASGYSEADAKSMAGVE